MDFKKAYAVDSDAAEEGKWLVTREGFDVKVAKLGNAKFKAEVQRLQKPHLAVLRSSSDSSKLVNSITIKAMARTILLDWKAESDGVTIEYTPELGEEYMTKYTDFKEDVSALSTSRSNFKPSDISEK